MAAPVTQRAPGAPGAGYPQQMGAAPAAQAAFVTQKAELAFSAIKKILDGEVAAYSVRVQNKASQNAPGLISVGVHDKTTGQASFMTVSRSNILKYAAPAQLKKLDTNDPVKREQFIAVLSETIKKLTGIYGIIISACEPDINGKMCDSKFVKAICVQATGI